MLKFRLTPTITERAVPALGASVTIDGVPMAAQRWNAAQPFDDGDTLLEVDEGAFRLTLPEKSP